MCIRDRCVCVCVNCLYKQLIICTEILYKGMELRAQTELNLSNLNEDMKDVEELVRLYNNNSKNKVNQKNCNKIL